MATTGLNMDAEITEQQIPIEECGNGNKTMTTNISISDSNDLTAVESLRCFVCDVKVQGRHYSLATCRTQSSRGRVIEKLGELVGERYLVVISEDDVICRSCANLMNTLDRLETEMRGVRDAVLRFLERKYALADGELLSNYKGGKPCQPPRITRVENGNTCHSRKRGAGLPSEGVQNMSKLRKTDVWLQCNKCRYTTEYNTFMVHHIRQHVKQKVFCDHCGIQFPGQQQQAGHRCFKAQNENDTSKENDGDVENGPIDKSEVISTLPIQVNCDSEATIKDDSIQLLHLSNTNDLQLESIMGSAKVGVHDQPVYVRVVRDVTDIDGIPHSAAVRNSNAEPGMIVKVVKDSSSKQLLTLSEDESLEMVEVACWDDVHPPDENPDISF
ncbi:uncharacterized protein LOC105700589 isoform X2 [Orussus abietinus]|uniref:uncharacterized protein LOC105700589 isoform X2 n=1 Tax=Orussus abietinus TaxID=222816 RepID=UPI000625BC31|nr:uncharacterized protein LOC105700589 isoform X2 [Orussus abietinus]